MSSRKTSQCQECDPWKVRTAQSGATYLAPHPEPEGAQVWFFTRRGGVSKPPYHTLNVSTALGDEKKAVTENLARIGRAMDDRPYAQTQLMAGSEVVRVEDPGLAGEADGLVTDRRDLPLVIAAADCAPVVLVGEGWVGIAHSGWRGTLSEVTAKTLLKMGNGSTGVKAYIGPSIQRCCYEVSEELAEKFTERFGSEVASGRRLSLPAAIRKNLEEAGIEEIHDLGMCTGCRTDLFFSHRKQGPTTGRNLAAVARS